MKGEGGEGRGRRSGGGEGRGGGEVNHGHCQPTGGPLSDVLLEREKQRRTSDKKHSPEKHKVSLIPKPQSSHTLLHYNHYA